MDTEMNSHHRPDEPSAADQANATSENADTCEKSMDPDATGIPDTCSGPASVSSGISGALRSASGTPSTSDHSLSDSAMPDGSSTRAMETDDHASRITPLPQSGSANDLLEPKAATEEPLDRSMTEGSAFHNDDSGSNSNDTNSGCLSNDTISGNNGNEANLSTYSAHTSAAEPLAVSAAGNTIDKTLRFLEFRNPGPKNQDAKFNPELSVRERRKLQRKLHKPQTRWELYDDYGCLLDVPGPGDNEIGLDLCDCLGVACPGCHMPCTKCGSEKCGKECRRNRRWVYERIQIEGRNTVVKFEDSVACV